MRAGPERAPPQSVIVELAAIFSRFRAAFQSLPKWGVPRQARFSTAGCPGSLRRPRACATAAGTAPPRVVGPGDPGGLHDFRSGLGECNAPRRNSDPGCVHRQALASVRGQYSGCQRHAWPTRFPSADLTGALERHGAAWQTGDTTCVIGNRVPARGHRWLATFRRGFPPFLIECGWDAAAPVPCEAPSPIAPSFRPVRRPLRTRSRCPPNRSGNGSEPGRGGSLWAGHHASRVFVNANPA